MPTTSFTLVQDGFIFIAGDSAGSSPTSTPATATATASAAIAATPRPRKPPKQKWNRCIADSVVSSGARAILIARIERMLRRGVIDLMEDDGATDVVAITTGELAVLLARLLPEEYTTPTDQPTPTTTPPGSDTRIAEYSRRVLEGEQLFDPRDATAHGANERGLRIVQRGNGTGPKIVGWMGDEAEELHQDTAKQ